MQSLTDDHTNLKREIEILKTFESSQSEKYYAFQRFIFQMASHARREESVVYSFMKLSDESSLRNWALDGREEHRLADQIIRDLLSSGMDESEWVLKTKSLAELVLRHIEEEEKEVFPRLRGELSSGLDIRLSENYKNSQSKIVDLSVYVENSNRNGHH
ncbi:MAG: hemerythrin domain-containing protein [Pseudobdellovibrio sp.]